MKVADYSFATFTAAELKAAGFDGVIRYLSPPPNEKNWTADQLAYFRANEMWCGCVWETAATRASDGYGAGVTDAHAANDLADNLGVPATVAIYYAVDTRDTPVASAEPYFRGIHDVPGRPVGIYGRKELAEAMVAAGHVRYMWMVETWWDSPPAPLDHPSVHLVQLANHHSLGGTDDTVVMRDDWGGWAPPGATPPPTTTTQSRGLADMSRTRFDEAAWKGHDGFYAYRGVVRANGGKVDGCGIVSRVVIRKAPDMLDDKPWTVRIIESIGGAQADELLVGGEAYEHVPNQGSGEAKALALVPWGVDDGAGAKETKGLRLIVEYDEAWIPPFEAAG